MKKQLKREKKVNFSINTWQKKKSEELKEESDEKVEAATGVAGKRKPGLPVHELEEEAKKMNLP
jgi:hypothetical protein